MSLDANGTRKLSTGFLRDLSNLGILACFATRINFANLIILRLLPLSPPQWLLLHQTINPCHTKSLGVIATVKVISEK